MSLAQTEQQSFSYQDYINWPNEERWEIIYGEAFSMSPAPTPVHQEIVGQLFKKLSELSNKKCKILMAPVDVLLPRTDEKDEQINTIVQPDLLVVCDQNKIKEKNIKGAPDFIVEVLSPATAKRDEGIKRDLYQASGVKEYWLVHPTDQTINQYSLTDNIYHKPQVYGADDTIYSSCIPDMSLDLAEIFNRS